MAFKIFYTEDSLTDLEGILEFIRADSPDAAAPFADAVLNHVELLAQFPHVAPSIARRRSVRSLLHTPIRIYYQIDEERKRVEILHVWWGTL